MKRGKKNLIFLLLGGVISLMVMMGGASQASADPSYFITTRKTDNPGTSNATSITIPTAGAGYNYDVDWNNDGVFDEIGLTSSVTHNFGTAGTYTIRIKGSFPRIVFNNAGDKLKILDIKQWGTGIWTNFATAFYGCENLQVSATDAPNLSQVNSLYAMFQGAKALTGNPSFNTWDTSNINDTSSMFQNAINFNAPIGNWKMSNAVIFASMFNGATSFNQNINAWDTSKVKNMSFMFNGATSFNQPLNNWNTSSVIYMQNMFYNAKVFNQDINTWNTTNLVSSEFMFALAASFNKPLNNWNTSNIISMAGMFSNATAFNQDISSWNTSKVTNMNSMFANASSFNQPLNTWNVSNVLTISSMFYGAKDFNQPLNNWDTSKVTNMSYVFTNATNFNQNINSWNTANVTLMNGMFQGASVFNQPLNSWNTSKVTNMASMFMGASSFNQPLNNWDTSKVTNMNRMFSSASVFNGDISSWDTTNVTDMAFMFYYASKFNTNISAWNTSKVTTMGYMFVSTLEFDQPIGAWNTSNVTTMISMFNGAKAFNQPIGTWNTSKVNDMNSMFQGAEAFNQPIGTWNISNVTNFLRLFHGAKSFNQPLNSWDTSKVINMSYTFFGASSFNQPLNNWNMSNVTTTACMFYGASSFNQPLASWDTAKVIDMNMMFYGAKAFNQPLGMWKTDSLVQAGNMFYNAGLQPDNYDNLLNGWAAQTRNNVNMANNVGAYYCNAEVARNTLISSPRLWKITDYGQACPPHSIALSASSVNEGTKKVGTFSAVATNGAIQYTLVSGEGDEDNPKFTLNLSSGVLAFLNAPDFEHPTDLGATAGDNTYAIRVRFTDSSSKLYTEQTFLISVLDIDDFPPEITITAPTKTSSGAITDTTIEVSDRFSIASIAFEGSTASPEALLCDKTLPYTNPTPLSGQHGVITCTIKIMSSGKLVITAKDSIGNTASKTEDNYRIDSVGPQLLYFNVDTEAPYTINAPQVHFDAVDSGSVAKYELIYRKDDGVSGTSPSEDTLLEIADATPQTLQLDPDETLHTITIKVYDELGNKTTRSIVFPPTLTFTAPTMMSNGTINDTTVTITAPLAGQHLENIEVSGTAGATLGTCRDINNTMTAPYDTKVICEVKDIKQTGVVTMKAKCQESGAVGQNSQKYFIETNKPLITISPSTTSSNQTITGTVTVIDDVALKASQVLASTTPEGQLSARSCTQTDGKRVDCSFSLSGSSSLTISASDQAGNTAEKTESGIVIDAEAPSVSISSPSAVNSTNQASYTLTGTCSSSDLELTITIGVQPHIALCSAEGKWELVTDLSHAPEGDIPVSVSQKDKLENEGTATATLRKDTQNPSLTTHIKEGDYLNTSLDQLSGSTKPNAIVSLTIGSQVFTGQADSQGNWTLAITPALSEAKHTITLSSKDSSGNESEVQTLSFTIDLTKPILTLSGASEIHLILGDLFTDAGATRSDAIDGTGSVYANNSDILDLTKVGTYVLEYHYSDQAGNSADPLHRTIIIEKKADPLKPVVPTVSVGGFSGKPVVKDHCPNGDASSSFYDGTCGTPAPLPPEPQQADTPSSEPILESEQLTAYERSYKNGITTLYPEKEARLFEPITRAELAKMMSVYAVKFLNKVPLTGKVGCEAFTDSTEVNAELAGFMKTSCELEIMGLENDGKTPLSVFRPNDLVIRAEFATVLSRMKWGNTYDNHQLNFRAKHIEKLQAEKILTINDPFLQELRIWIMTMLWRGEK